MSRDLEKFFNSEIDMEMTEDFSKKSSEIEITIPNFGDFSHLIKNDMINIERALSYKAIENEIIFYSDGVVVTAIRNDILN